MANIIIPSKIRYASKPPVGSTIDKKHPLARGLMGYWLMNERSGNIALDLVDKNHMVLGGGANFNAGPEGQGILCNVNNSRIQVTCPSKLKLPFPITVMCYCRVVGTPSDYANFFGISCNDTEGSPYWNFQISRRGTGYFGSGFVRIGSYNDTATSYTVVNGKYMLVVCFPNAGQVLVYINNVLTSLTSGSTDTVAGDPNAYSATSQIHFGCINGSNRNINTIFYYGGIYNRVLTRSEIRQLYFQPYQFITPPKRRVFFVTGGEQPSQTNANVNATLVSASINVGTVTLSNQKNSYITATAIASSVSVGTVSLSNQKNANITASLITASVSVGAVSVSTDKNVNFTASIITASLVVNAVTVTAEGGGEVSVNVNATTVSASMSVGTTTLSNAKNCDIQTSLIASSIIVNSPTVTCEKSNNISATEISSSFVVLTPVVTTEKHCYFTASIASVTIKVGTVTVSTAEVVPSGISERILRKSQIEKIIDLDSGMSKQSVRQSRIEKSILLKSSIP